MVVKLIIKLVMKSGYSDANDHVNTVNILYPGLKPDVASSHVKNGSPIRIALLYY